MEKKMTVKEKLNKRLSTLNTREGEVMQSIVAEEDKEKRAALGATLTALRDDIAEVEEMLAQIDEPAGDEGGAEGASAEGRGLSVVGTMQTRKADAETGTGSMEYRKAFQQYMATGKMTKRADETTGTADVGVVIPENLVNKILEKFEELGTIYNLVTHTAFPVGQSIPTDSVKPTATWVAEGASSDAQKKGLGALITFAAYKLRCEIRMTEEVSVMTLPAFEALFVKQVGEAMLRAKEQAIISGDGAGKPTGILNGAAPEGQAIEGALSYKLLCDAEAALPAEYEANAKWAMTKKQFMAFIGMVDSQKQPIARVNYGIDGKPERYLLGREVVVTAAMAEQTVDAIIYDFSDYALNTNYNLGIKHAQDWDNEDHKTKAVESVDGKCIDRGSLVTVKVTA